MSIVPNVAQPNWRDALCRDHDPELFFALDREDDARAVCAECPIRWECLSWALAVNENHGVWGGMSGDQRQNVKFRRHRVKCPHCGGASVDAESRTRTEICRSCGLSWLA